MRAVDLIVKKRNGSVFDDEEIRFLIQGYVSGEIPDYQMAGLAMAIFFQGLSFEETGFLTRAMIDSGEVIDLSGLSGPLVDKHSTGGVGDKVSLVLAPLAASCGLCVPRMSGRALGHTGGTLDKLESIPGYRTDLNTDEFRQFLKTTGFAMTGQSEQVVPADRKLYALRDVTGTIESIPLITASIMSKKFAEGAEALVFDVKCGSGAFMKTVEDAEKLAISLVKTGMSLGRRINALITDMDQPLGRMVGNFLEVREVIDCLHDRGPDDLMDLTYSLTARMLVLGGKVTDSEAGVALCRQKITDGSAWKKFLENVELQGGNPETVVDPDRGPVAPLQETLNAVESGYVGRIDAFQVGLAAGQLGAGRERKGDPVLPDVGVEILKIQGDAVGKGEPLCRIYARDRDRIDRARDLLSPAFIISDMKSVPGKRLLKSLIE